MLESAESEMVKLIRISTYMIMIPHDTSTLQTYVRADRRTDNLP